jgi:hypothetical protein
MITLLFACVPEVKESADSSSSTDDSSQDSEPIPDSYQLLIGTTDYSTGVLASLEWPDGSLKDGITALSSDNAVSTSGELGFVLGRSSENTVRVYEADLSTPIAEFSTGDASNPQDAVACNGSYLVSLYNESGLGVYSTDGIRSGTVDLSAFEDDSGTPEPSGMYLAPNGFVYVAMNRLSTDYRAYVPGILAKVDCTSWSVVDSLEVVSNTRILPDPLEPNILYLTGGNYYTPDYSGPELDGGVWRFDTATGSLEENALATEAAVGKNIGIYLPRVSGDPASGALMVQDDGYQWSIVCTEASGDSSTILDGNMFISSAAAAEDGALWLAARPGFGAGTSREGVLRLDRTTCTITDQYQLALPPGSLAIR